MKPLSKKGMSLFGAALAVCVFAVPSMASASSWGVIGSTHTLISANLGYVAHGQTAPVTWTCLSSQFHVNVANAAALRVTGVAFRSCSTIGLFGGCTVTPTATQLPWTITGTTTSNIQIEGLNMDLRFETLPPGGGSSCFQHNQNVTWTGTLNGGVWNAAQHEMNYTAATGTTLHGLFSSTHAAAPMTVMGTIRDTSQTLTLT
jgi:hypothetical protein